MNRLILFLTLALFLFLSACSVLPNPLEITDSVTSDPNAGTPVVSEQPASQPNVVTATPPGQPAEVVLTPAPVKTDPAVPTTSAMSAEQFDSALIAAIESKDFGKLRGLMGSQFTLAYWRSEGNTMHSDAALAEMSKTVLGGGATPAASTGIDTTALLEGADPLNFFQPDAVRAVYFDFVGSQGTDQALAIIARDPVSGARYWKGILVAFGGFRQLEDSTSDLNQFSQQLASAFQEQDLTALHAMMGDGFSIAKLDPPTLDGSLTVVTREEAIHELRWGVLGAGVEPVIMWASDIPALLSGSDPLAQWGPNAPVISAMHITNLGALHQGEAVLVIGREPSGRLYWHGMLLPLYGESFDAPLAGPVGDALPTEIKYVIPLDDVNVRSGPGMHYAVEGMLRQGETATVTGISGDGSWWQFVCAQDSSGRCWVSADPTLTQATYLP